MNKGLDRLLSTWGMAAADPTDVQAEAPDLQALHDDLAAAAALATDWREQVMLHFRPGLVALLQGETRSQALPAFQRMQTLAEAIPDKALTALSLVALAVTYDTIGQRLASQAAAQRAERFAAVQGEARLVALALNAQAQFYKETGENAPALALFQRMQAIAVATGDAALQMGSYIGFGRTLPMTEAASATDYYQQAIGLAMQRGDSGSLALCYNNLADWQIYAGAYPESIGLREQSLDLSRRSADAIGVARALLGMAKAETLLGHYPRAWELLRQGLPLVLRAEDVEGELHCNLNLAHLYALDGDVPRACDYYQRTLEKSLAAPDATCARFAREALAQLAHGDLPRPGIMPQLGPGGAGAYLYPTGDRNWSGLWLFWPGV